MACEHCIRNDARRAAWVAFCEGTITGVSIARIISKGLNLPLPSDDEIVRMLAEAADGALAEYDARCKDGRL